MHIRKTIIVCQAKINNFHIDGIFHFMYKFAYIVVIVKFVILIHNLYFIDALISTFSLMVFCNSVCRSIFHPIRSDTLGSLFLPERTVTSAPLQCPPSFTKEHKGCSQSKLFTRVIKGKTVKVNIYLLVLQ